MTSSIPSHWLCPACQLPLRQTEQTLGCDNQHQYDVAKQGYELAPCATQKANTLVIHLRWSPRAVVFISRTLSASGRTS